MPASFNGIRNYSHMEKIISSVNSLSFCELYFIQCFFFIIAGDDVKANDSELLYFCKVFRY